MFVILTSKPGQFRSEIDPAARAAVRPVETYDYYFYGRKRAEFVIAELVAEARICIVDTAGADVVNRVPTKFLPRFATIGEARAQIGALAGGGGLDSRLVCRSAA